MADTDTRADGWQRHLVDDEQGITRILRAAKRIAVLGIKAEPWQPAFFVPAYAASAGYEIIPVPVYYPDVTEMMGRPVYRSLAAIPGPIDLVDVFRRPHRIPDHVDDMLAAHPACVWFQLGIRNDEAAETLARAGIDVVQDHCLMSELERRGMGD
ncbi:MAG TPA: CoA-binding protein [Gemmatimonadaceae bacterium]|nr:CoA-binding protein [Gemmatimonadaceae bacterium]